MENNVLERKPLGKITYNELAQGDVFRHKGEDRIYMKCYCNNDFKWYVVPLTGASPGQLSFPNRSIEVELVYSPSISGVVG